MMAQHQTGCAQESPLDSLAPRYRRAAHARDLFVGQRFEECCAHIFVLLTVFCYLR
jgi:hypothetical protein